MIGAVVNAVAYTVQVASMGQAWDAGAFVGAVATGVATGAVTAMSFVVEPIDYAMTAVQCVTDGCSLAEVALTVVPGAIGPVAKQIDNVLDVAKAAENASDGVKAVETLGDAGGAAKASSFTSPDPLVGDVANAIESKYPGHVEGTNVRLNGAEVDIETGNAFIEIKSGGGKKAGSQVTRLQNPINNPKGKPVIVYGPNLRGSVIDEVTRRGGLATRDLDVLLEVLRP